MIAHQHGTALGYRQNGLLLIGPPGCGKSSLALQLIRLGCELVADDQVLLQPDQDRWIAGCPEVLRGRLHVRGLGFIDAAHRETAPVACIFQSDRPAFTLSRPPALDVPVIVLDFFRPDAAAFVIATLGGI